MLKEITIKNYKQIYVTYDEINKLLKDNVKIQKILQIEAYVNTIKKL